MDPINKKGWLRYFFRAPVYLYHWHLGRLLGHRFLLLVHTGRRSGFVHETVLEILEYRRDGPEAIVMSGFGTESNWLRNIDAIPNEQVVIGAKRFNATHRFLGEQEAIVVIRNYESRNWYIAPIVHFVLRRLLGWNYRGAETDRLRLVRQLPLLAFRPRR